MASKQAEENELGAQCALGGSGVKGGGARSKRREARELEASCGFARLQGKHHLHQVMESKHAQVSIGTDLKSPPLILKLKTRRRYPTDLHLKTSTYHASFS